MTSIFLSYRREDSRHQAGRLHDRLVTHFGPSQVFKDVDSIPLGWDFREVLTERVAACDVLLVVIGDRWLSVVGQGGARRLDDPGDFVRIEIEAALGRKIPVIPVLVGDAPVPRAEELPDSLRDLSFRNGLAVRPDPDFHKDMDRLIRGIEQGVSLLRQRPAPRGPEPAPLPTPEPVTSPPPKKADDGLVTNTLAMTLKLIPAGEFLMGSDASDPDANDFEKVNGKKHPVRISKPFYLGTTEVTVGQFRKFVEATGYKTDAEKNGGGYGWNAAKGEFEQDPKYTWRSPGFPQTDDHPVVLVSWNDAVALCDWLSQEEGKTYRLPTEAEWEYAYRSGRTTRYSSGDDPESLATVAHFGGGTAKEKYPYTAPVGRFQPNAFGLYDMHGNVWEWCADWYDSDYYAKSPPLNPLNSSPDSYRVFRGGSWYNAAEYCRAAYRDGRTPTGTGRHPGLAAGSEVP